MKNPRWNHYLRPLVAPCLAAALLAAGPPGPANHTEPIRRAIAALTQSYLMRPGNAEEEQLAARIRSAAIDRIAAGGMLAREPLREALQQEPLPPPLFYTLATLLVLGEGPTAAAFIVGASEKVDPAKSPGEAFYLAHTLMLRAPKEASALALQLAALPASTRFPVPAEEIAFPLVSGIGFLFAAGQVEALNELAALLGRVEELAPAQAETLLRAAGQLHLAKLVPLLVGKSRTLAADSPVLRPLIYALGQIDDLRAAERLGELADGAKDPAIREEAVFALGELTSPVCERALLGALADPAPRVRRYAVAALASLATPAAREALRAALGGAEPEPAVRADLLRAAQAVGDRSWGKALKRAEGAWPALAGAAREAFLRVQPIAPYREREPEPLWPELPLNPLTPGEVTAELWRSIQAGGAGFSAIKKRVLYSATPAQIPHLETLRMVAAGRLTRQGLGAWLDVLDTLKLLRRRLREDPRPTFARGAAPARRGGAR